MKKLITTLALVSTLALTGVASAQSTSTTATSSTDDVDTTVGVPNTGAGGDSAMNVAILATSAAVAIAAGAYALRRPQHR